MNKLPYSEEQGMQLVKDGHLSHDTFKHIQLSDGFTQRLADGGEVEPEETPVEAPQPTINNGDIHPIDFLMNGMQSGGSQEAYDQSMASLPKTADGSDPAAIPGGVQVASNDPNADRQIASGLTQPSSTEAGHMDPSALAQPAAAPAEAKPSDLEKLANPNNIASGMNLEKQGLKESFAEGKKQAAETAGLIHGFKLHQEAQELLRQKQEDEWKTEGNAQLQKTQEAAYEAAQAAKIDPNNFWNSRTTGQKVAGIIGLMLGGIGGGVSGHGGNVAMDMLNKAIDRDIDAQKFNADKKQQNFSNQMGIYGMMRQKFGDGRQAYAATQLAYLQSAEMQIRETAAKYQEPQMQAQMQIAVGKLQQRQSEIARGVVMAGYQSAAMHQLMNGGQVGVAGLSALPKDVQSRLVPLDGGASHGVAFHDKSADEVRAVSSAADNVKGIIAEMRKLKDDGGKRLLPYGTLAAKSQALQSRLIPALNEMAGLKRLSEEDIKNLKQQIPDPGSWMSSKSDALLDGLERSVHDRTESYYKNNLMGYKPSHFTPKR